MTTIHAYTASQAIVDAPSKRTLEWDVQELIYSNINRSCYRYNKGIA
jgi:glyceraldehyde-3-phosphate dehydrogenase/erythrose-4-phosphate dehydrogenase